MKRIQLLVSGTAALFVLAGCQPSQNSGGTGATPGGMPSDTMTAPSDTIAATTKSGVVALALARPQE